MMILHKFHNLDAFIYIFSIEINQFILISIFLTDQEIRSPNSCSTKVETNPSRGWAQPDTGHYICHV